MEAQNGHGRQQAAKPLGGRAYGSTPHLPGSRVGPGDWHIHEGQARILTERARDRRDRILVTEKLDGSCVAAARSGVSLIPLTRAGYHAADSHFEMHRRFAAWLAEREARILPALLDGERFACEWLEVAHGTRYALASPEDMLVGFAVMSGKTRLPHDEARRRMEDAGIPGARVLSDGPPMSVAAAIESLGDTGFHGALEEVEGAVWVCERDGRFDFIAKHVRLGKEDGKYLALVTGGGEVLNAVAGR